MSSTVFSDVEDYLSSNGQNLYSDDEHFRPQPRWDSDSSVSPNRPSDDEELARPRADSVRTANTSVASGSQPIKRRLRDEWDLRVIIKHTLPNGTDRIEAELKCSSAILCDSSRKLKAMIQTEGRTRRIGGGPQRSLEIITPPFSTAEAVDILICSMHHYNPYRRIESFEDLLHLAIACWSLECSTGPIENLGDISKSDLWRPRPQVLRGNNRQDYRYVGWVFVALVFGWDDVFREASREVAMGGRRAIEYDGDYLPHDLRGKKISHNLIYSRYKITAHHEREHRLRHTPSSSRHRCHRGEANNNHRRNYIVCPSNLPNLPPLRRHVPGRHMHLFEDP